MSNIEAIGLPSDPYAERMVLGSILLNGTQYPQYGSLLAPDDFSSDSHSRIWRCYLRLYEAGVAIDRVTVATDMSTRGELESIGGITALAYLDDGLPELYNLESYVRIVADKATRRRLILSANSLIQRASTGIESTAELIEAASGLSALSVSTADPMQSPLDCIQDAGGIDAYLAEGRLLGLQWPVARLTASTGGMMPGDLVIVAAGTGRGKTAFALWCALHAATKGAGVAVQSLEMSKRQLINRMLSHCGSYNSSLLRRGNLSIADQHAICTSAADLCDLPIYISDSTSGTVSGLIGSVTRMRTKKQIGLVIVDYLQLMTGPGRSRVEQVGSVARGLKNAAMELGLPIMALSQLSRDHQKAGTTPQLQDLRESGDIEQAANAVLMLHGTTAYESQPTELLPLDLIVAKMRDGAANYKIPLMFRADCGRFIEVD